VLLILGIFLAFFVSNMFDSLTVMAVDSDRDMSQLNCCLTITIRLLTVTIGSLCRRSHVTVHGCWSERHAVNVIA